jgi:hypothetical protein
VRPTPLNRIESAVDDGLASSWYLYLELLAEQISGAAAE